MFAEGFDAFDEGFDFEIFLNLLLDNSGGVPESIDDSSKSSF